MPPALILSGAADGLVGPAMLEEFQRRMSAAGARCERRLYPGRGYCFFNWQEGKNPDFAAALAEVEEFLAGLGFMEKSQAGNQAAISASPPHPSGG